MVLKVIQCAVAICVQKRLIAVLFEIISPHLSKNGIFQCAGGRQVRVSWDNPRVVAPRFHLGSTYHLDSKLKHGSWTCISVKAVKINKTSDCRV